MKYYLSTFLLALVLGLGNVTAQPPQFTLEATPNNEDYGRIHDMTIQFGPTCETAEPGDYLAAIDPRGYVVGVDAVINSSGGANLTSYGPSFFASTTTIGIRPNEEIFVAFYDVSADKFYTLPLPDTTLCCYTPNNLNQIEYLSFETYCFGREVDPAIFPIQLISFTGEPDNGRVKLSWSTAMENNNSYFSVERSKDGEAYERIGQIDGAGNSSTRRDYTFWDSKPMNGVNYYRLKQVDFDGNSSLSDVVAVLLTSKNIPAGVYPNPVHQAAWVSLPEAWQKGTTTVVVRDVSGKEYSKVQVSDQSGLNLNTVDLEAGMYIIEMRQGDQLEVLKLIRAGH